MEITRDLPKADAHAGTLPSNWLRLKKLDTLDLGQNNLTGERTATLAHACTISVLICWAPDLLQTMNCTNCAGRLPDSWAALFTVYRHRLSRINVTSNQLTGLHPLSKIQAGIRAKDGFLSGQLC